MMETIMRAGVPHPLRTGWPRLKGRRLLAVLAEFDARYRARIRLDSLDEHLLRDIGVTRAEVEAELRR